jgi:hypothetical protein
MKLSELYEMIGRMATYGDQDAEVVIQIKLPYATVGAQPRVPVKNVQMGFDWDQGKFFIVPEEDLTPSDRDFAKQMKEMQDRAGWAAYENRNLKAEIKQLKKQLKATP